MPNYVLNRNYTLVTLSGRAIGFEKGKPTHVPPDCIRAVVSIGAVPADGVEPDLRLEDEMALQKAPTEPGERQERILETIRNLVARNDRDDFTAAGIPSPKVVSKILGWRADLREVNAVWRLFCEEKAAIQEQLEQDNRASA